MRAAFFAQGLLLVGIATAATLHAQTPATPVTPTTAEQWVAKANAVADIRTPGSAPFHLHATFHASGKVEVTGDGTYDLFWYSPTRWREEVSLGSYHEVVTQSGELHYRDPRDGYLPARAMQTMTAALIAPVKFQRTIGKDDLHRVLVTDGVAPGEIGLAWQIDKPSDEKTHAEPGKAVLFLDAATGRVLRDTNPSSIWTYSDFADFHGAAIARRGALTESGQQVLVFQISELADAAPRPDQDFVFNNGSGHIYTEPLVVTPPRVLHTVDPRYSKYARDKRIQGSCLIGIVVDQQGKPRDIHVVKSLEPSLDANAMEAIRHYKFTPALHDGQPVAVVLTIEVEFRII